MACGCGGSQQGGQAPGGSGSGQAPGSGARGPGSPGYFWKGPERPKPAPKPA